MTEENTEKIEEKIEEQLPEKETDEQKAVLYRTSDIYFSAYLCALDLPLETTENEEGTGGRGRKVIFVFKIPQKHLQKLKASYFGGSGTVKVAKYVSCVRSLKQVCFV